MFPHGMQETLLSDRGKLGLEGLDCLSLQTGHP